MQKPFKPKEGQKLRVFGYSDTFIFLRWVGDLVRCKPDRKDTTKEYEFPAYKIQEILK
jgi:hypothetical protein